MNKVPSVSDLDEGKAGLSNDMNKMKRDLLKKSADLKNRYHKAVAVQTSIVWNIKNDEKYAWADNPNQTARWKEALAGLDVAIDADKCCRFFLTNADDDVKWEWGDHLTANLHKFAGLALTSAIETLEKQQVRFNKMHLMNLQG